jgi:ubiquinone/menaquinone biosynthesis C-methylase UbiE
LGCSAVDVYEHLYKEELVRTARITRPDDFVIDFVRMFEEKECGKVLDLGCGAGRNAVFLAKEGFYVVGVDISSTALKMALQKVKEAKLQNCSFVRQNFLKIPFLDSLFDAVVSCYSIENQPLPEIKEALGEIRRVTTDRGLVLTTLHSTKHWRFGLGKQISPGTFLATETIGGRKVRFKTHFFDKEEVKRLFRNRELHILSIKESVKETDKKRVHWIVRAEKASLAKTLQQN